MTFEVGLMPAGAFVDAGGEAFVFVAFGAGGEDEAAVAVGALDEGRLAHLQIDPRVAERAADAVAGDAPGVDLHLLGRRAGRGELRARRRRLGTGLDFRRARHAGSIAPRSEERR